MFTSMPVLYDDVLLDIMAAAPIEVTARLMAVSRFLYLHGPKYVLSEPPFLKDERQLLSRSWPSFRFSPRAAPSLSVI